MSKRFLRQFDASQPRRWMRWGRNLLWVVIVTVMIWVYADMEFTRERQFTVTVRLLTEDPDLTLLSDREVELTFTVEGSMSSLESFDRRPKMIEYDVSRYGAGDGPTPVPTREVLLASGGITQAGLTLVSSRPSTINVHLDVIRTETLDVRFDYTGATLAGPPVISPSEVRVRVAESRWREILSRDPSPAIATETVNLRNVPDTSKPITAELNPVVEGVRVEPAVETVSVRVEVAELTATKTIPVTVRVLSPSAWASDGTWREFTLERKDPLEWRKQMLISGPREEVERLRPEQVEAYVELTENDKSRTTSWWRGDVKVRFPPDSKLELAGQTPTVEYRLVRREATTP